jgi:hypothetical protein
MNQTLVLRRVFLMLFIATLSAGAAWFIFTQQYTAWDFRNNLWAPAHLLVNRQSPYHIEQLFDHSNAVWMPTIIGALFPLGWLPEAVATNLWLLLMPLAVLAVYWLTIKPWNPPLPLTALALTSAFVFLPLVSHIVLGQFSLFAGLLLLIAVRLLMQGQYNVAALLMVLAATKPQLVILPVMGLLFLAHRQQNLFRLIAGMLVWTVLLLLPLWVFYPNWVEGFLVALGRNPCWMHPSIFTLSDFWRTLLWGVSFAAALVVNAMLWRRLPPVQALPWSLAINLLVTPYVWSWDFVLLFPLLFQTFVGLRSWVSRGVLIAGYIVVWTGIVLIRLNTEGDDVRFWWVAWSVVLIVLIAQFADRRATVLPDAPAPS